MALVDKESLNIIEKEYKKIFEPQILSRGEALYKNDAIFSFEQINAEKIKGLVQGGQVYSTSINIDPEENMMYCVCSCRYKYDCKHAAALVLRVLDEKDKNIVEITRRNESINTLNKTFGNQSADQYRILPGLDTLSLKEVVRHLSKRHNSRKYSNQIEIFFEDSQTLRVESNYKDWQGRAEKKQEAIISIQIEHDLLQIKCNTCDSISNKLCDHQQLILGFDEVIKNIEMFYTGELSYDEILSKFVEDLSMDKEGIKKYFNLILDKEFAYLSPKSKDLIVQTSDVVGLDRYLKVKNDDEDQLVKQIEEQRNLGNALVWGSRAVLSLVAGKLHKSKSQLSSNIEEQVFPTFFDNDQLVFYTKLVKSLNIKSSYLSLSVLKENRHLLENMINYYSINDHETKIRKKDLQYFTFSDQLVSLESKLTSDDYLNIVELKFNIGDQQIVPKQVDWFNEYFIIYNKVGYLIENAEIIDFLVSVEFRNQIKLLKNNEKTLNDILNKIEKFGPVSMEEVENINLQGGRRHVHIREVGKHLIFEPTLLYEEHRFSIYENAAKFNPTEKQRYIANEEEVETFIELMKELHPDWRKDNIPQKYVYIHIDDVLKNMWFLDFFDKAKENDIHVFGQDNLENLKFNSNRVSVRSHIVSGIDWFKADVDMSFGDQKVSYKDWIEAVKNNEKYIQLDDGSIGVLPEEWMKKLKKIASVSTLDGEELNISKLKFNIIDQLFEEIDDIDLLMDLKRKKDALANYESNKKYELPTGITAELRPYQKDGFQWLKFLDEFEFGGCLADDMGLGKTLQVIMLLVDQKEMGRGTSLVVIPRSLLFNWAAEIEKFAPGLTYLIHHGPLRDKLLTNYDKYDLIISTYDTVSRDIKSFTETRYNYVILDESQAIKNPRSQRFKAMKLLKSRNKIAMTGTPIENNTFDLYAQFSFLNPGIFGSQKSFKDIFSIPIDVNGDEEALGTLKSIIHPFILRRTKENVAKDLPEKTESIIYCEMGQEQRALYETLRAKIKKDIHSKVEEEGVNSSKFMILDGLLRLRQLCNSPELVDGNLTPKQNVSVKVDTLMAQLTEDLGNHKALVFSQFVSMLGIIKKALDEKGLKYAYLDGSTRDRQAAVKKFMEEDDCHIFMISIKAGNTGLNLTKADYVYIVDPWWNPAVEAQAIDRTHRIGQTNNIFAYKMICKDTIEEKIVELQQKKKKLAKDLIQVDESVFKSLDKTELLALFD